MSPNRPPRLPGFTYAGMHRYFVTICTADRQPVFQSRATVDPLLCQLLQCATQCRFSVYAYCFMPDHLHALLAAQCDTALLLECVRRFKQVSAFAYRRRTGRVLWQAGFFERVLRDDEESETVARYVLENPVRAGLTRAVQDYPFSGSQVFEREALADLCAGTDGRG